MKFIKVMTLDQLGFDEEDRTHMYVNVDHIIYVCGDEDGAVLVVTEYLPHKRSHFNIDLAEGLSEVMQLIEEATS